MSEQQAGESSGRVRKKSRKLLEAEEDNLETMKSPPAKRQRKSLEDGRTAEKTGQPSPGDSPLKSKSGTKNVIKVKSKPKSLSVDNKEGEKEPGKTPRGKTDTKVTTKNKPKASVAMAAPKQQKPKKVASVSEEQPKKDQPASDHNQAPSVPGGETSTESLELKSKAFEKSINTKPTTVQPAVGDDVGEIPLKTKKRSKVTQPSPSISTPSPTGLARKREKKIKAPDSPDMEGHKKLKKCEKAGCPASFIICFSNASEKCARNGYTSRWYHMSPGEHFCNDCFDYFYRSHKGGYEDFTKWKRFWSTNGKTEASLKVYMADQCLPYWVRCNRCSKWRQLGSHCDFTTELVKKFECGMNGQGVKKEGNAACDVLEDKRVSEVFEPGWISTLWNPPYLVNSPAAPFLTEYYPDGVGMSASSTQNKSMNGKRKRGLKKQGSSDSESSETSSEESSLNSSGQSKTDPTGHDIPGLSPYLRPFYQPEEQRTACTVRPDVMDDQEVQEFPDFAAAQHMYLGIRNLVIAMWNLNIKEWLTAEKCAPYLLCRGLVRIRCYQELSRVIAHLTRVGWINFGIISPPPDLSVLPDRHKPEVIVIGAGAAGLGAAKQLKNFAAKVCILEAADRIGGRVWDDQSLGVCAGRGAMLVNGCINNPICVMCEQAGIKLHPISPTCDLIDESGKQIDGSTDKRIDFHFNALLDIIAEWRKERDSHKDCSLLDKLTEMHQQFIEESQLTFTEEELNLLQFHMSNLEYACGCDLSKLSAINWDQNEAFPQFSGNHALVGEGYSTILNRLADGLEIKLNTKVKSVDYSGDKVVVSSENGQKWTADKVIITVPLSLLQKSVISFTPSLPEHKVKAFHKLGTGVTEKIALQFPERFWQNKAKRAGFFGHVPSDESQRGLFSMFYDLTPKDNPSSPFVLISQLSGKAVEVQGEKTDEEIVKCCVGVLGKLFPEKPIPEPEKWFVTRWHSMENIGMAYSYVPIGSGGDTYDIVAEDVDQKVFFGGEATQRQFPQTVTGAYLSGVREAAKIITLPDTVES